VAFTSPALNAAVDAIAALGARISFHTADPGTTGANEISGTGRPATTWGTTSNGTKVGSQVSAAISGSTTATHWGIWTAPTGGVFLYGGALGAPESFGSAGTLLHTPTLTVANP
jgi:hypothetical protein